MQKCKYQQSVRTYIQKKKRCANENSTLRKIYHNLNSCERFRFLYADFHWHCMCTHTYTHFVLFFDQQLNDQRAMQQHTHTKLITEHKKMQKKRELN